MLAEKGNKIVVLASVFLYTQLALSTNLAAAENGDAYYIWSVSQKVDGEWLPLMDQGEPQTGDWESSITMKVLEADPLEFRAKVECLSGCFGSSVCEYPFTIKNMASGELVLFTGSGWWKEPGIHEYELTLENPENYVRNGEVEFHISFKCNMDGKQLETKPASKPEIRSTITVYLDNPDDDDLYVNLHLDRDNVGALNVPSSSVGNLFGKYEVSPGSHRLKISWEDPDTCKQYQVETEEKDIAQGESLEVNLSTEEHQLVAGAVKIYVENQDDDDLQGELWIGDISKGSIEIPAGSIQEAGSYELGEGHQYFRVTWTDQDTGESYETSMEADIFSGKTTEVMLSLGKHQPQVESLGEKPSLEEGTAANATAVINLRNYDQDEVEVAIYVDGESMGKKTLLPKSQQVQSVPVLSGHHTFLMEWKDPDTGEKVHQGEFNATFQPKDVRKVNLNVPENKGTNVEVYVMNKYPVALEVFLEINESYQGSKIIPPGSYMRHFGTYPVPPGNSAFRVFWEDPDTGQAFWSQSNHTFQEGESKAVKLVAAKKGPALEVTVRPAGMAMEVGDNKNLDITINNTGDETARLVDLILLSKDTQTAVLSTTSLTVGDLQAGQSWKETSFPPYIRALKAGETAVEVKARAEGLGEVTREVKVVVLEKGKLSFKEEDLGEPAEIRQSDVVAREAFGGSGDFPSMLEAAEGEISESFSKDGIDAVLAVQSAGKAGFAVEGQKLRATLAIANKNSYPVGVAAAIVLPPQDVFRYSEGSYYVTVESPLTSWYRPEEHYALTNLLTWPSKKMMESLEVADEWTWRNIQGPLQLRYGGGVFILEPGYVMIFSSEITPQQSGYLDIKGEIYYTKGPRETYTYAEMCLPFALGVKAAKVDLERLEQVTLAKSVQVEEKKCRVWGLVCF